MGMHSEKVRKGLALLMALVMMMCGLAGAEAAKVEDLAAAFYMALGGTAGATEEAVETLSGLGLIPADWTADTELTGAMAQQFVQSFSALAGAEMGIELPEGASDRALTRGELAVVLYPLFSEP